MSKNLNKITMAAGLSLALAFSLSSCSSETVDKIICKKDGFDWDDDAKVCMRDANNGGCPIGTAFEDGKCVDADNAAAGEWGMWWSFTDINNDGISTIKTSEKNKAVTASGNIAKNSGDLGGWGYAGWGTSDDEVLKKAKNAKSVSFNVKGDGKTYRLLLETSDTRDHGNNDYFAEFAGDGKKSFCIPGEFKQQDWAANTIQEFKQNNIIGIKFMAHTDHIIGNFNVTIDNLEFSNSPCNP